jgi:hypothetical protein
MEIHMVAHLNLEHWLPHSSAIAVQQHSLVSAWEVKPTIKLPSLAEDLESLALVCLSAILAVRCENASAWIIFTAARGKHHTSAAIGTVANKSMQKLPPRCAQDVDRPHSPSLQMVHLDHKPRLSVRQNQGCADGWNLESVSSLDLTLHRLAAIRQGCLGEKRRPLLIQSLLSRCSRLLPIHRRNEAVATDALRPKRAVVPVLVALASDRDHGSASYNHGTHKEHNDGGTCITCFSILHLCPGKRSGSK